MLRVVCFGLWFGGGWCLLAGGGAQAADFVRGDANESSKLEITDAIHTLQYLFQGKGEALRCLDAADTDDDGAVGLPDAILSLEYLFRAGREPLQPYPACGADPSADGLDCPANEACREAKITVFDAMVDADGVFFVIDRSGTFSSPGGTSAAKQGALATIASLDEKKWFGVIFVDKSVLRFPSGDSPAQANEEMRASGIAFVTSVASGSGSCDLPGILVALEFARRTGSKRNAIFYCTDGGGTCPGALTEGDYLAEMRRAVMEANQGLAELHTVAFWPPGDMQEQHLRDLAEQNGGEFHWVPLR